MNFEEGIIVSFARTVEARDELLNEGKRVLFCSEQPVFLPEQYVLNTNKTTEQRLQGLSDYDVLEFYSDTSFQVYYHEKSSDNALVLTSKCNSNCIMCPCPEDYRKGPSYETPEHICELIRYIPSDTPFLTLTGGEPTLLKEGIFPVLSTLKSHFEGTKFFFLTNGRTFSNIGYLNRFLEMMPDDIRFCIPIYGYSPETHDPITQADGSFIQAVNGIKNLLKRNCEVEIRIVISKLNAEFMDETAKFISRNFRGVACVNIMATEMCGAAAANKHLVWMDYKECFEHSKYAIQILMENQIDVRLYNFPLCKVDRAYWQLCKQSITDYKIRFREACDHCSVKAFCGGVFGTTLALTKMELEPIGESK